MAILSVSSPLVQVEEIGPKGAKNFSAHRTTSAPSYAIGPLALEQITRIEAPLPDGEVCSLLVPVTVPRSILDHPAFQDGYQWGNLSREEKEEPGAETSSVPRLVNAIALSLMYARLSGDSENDLPWEVGRLLRDLTCLAERDQTLAVVGLAHLCFLLPLFRQPRPANWPRYEPYDAYFLHDQAVRDYRARVRVYRRQGKSYEVAQRLALVGTVQ